MSQEGTQEAFCPLLWRANGGQVDADGNPVLSANHARGNCTRPYDCNECGLMQHEISFHAPGTVIWVCPDCIRDVINYSKQNGSRIHVPGFFSEGDCEFPGCRREVKQSKFRQVVFGFH